MNQTQAEERIENYIGQIISELPGDADIPPVNDPSSPACEGEPGDDNHKVNVRHVFWIDGIPEWQNEEIVEYLHSYWNTGNWHVTTGERPESPRLKARNRADDFGMDLAISEDGRLSLGAYSPCVHADENS